MSLHFPGQTASARPRQTASTAVTRPTDTVFLTLYFVWHFVIPVIFLKGHCVSLISSISPCFGNVLQKQAILECFAIWCYLFFLKAFLHVFICVSADGLCGSQFSPTTTQVLGIYLGSPGLEVSLYLHSHLWVLFCCPYLYCFLFCGFWLHIPLLTLLL